MAMLDFDSQFIDCPIAALNAAGVYDAAYKLDLLDGTRVDEEALDKAGDALDRYTKARAAMREAIRDLHGDHNAAADILSDLTSECVADARTAINVVEGF